MAAEAEAEASHEQHKSPLSKLKNLFNSNADHASTADDSVEATRERLHNARTEHERREQEADRLMLEREAAERSEAMYSSPPPERGGAPGVDSAAAGASHAPRRQASIKKGDTGLSSLKPRGSLKRAARNERPRFEADMDGVTHIPESQLHPRSHEMQHTALRPSNMDDPTAMDGKPTARDESSAGEDLSL